MPTIKEICNYMISPVNYKYDTKSLTVSVYKEFGLDLDRLNGVDLLFGSAEVPKLTSVMRRVQRKKKQVASQIKLAKMKES